MQHCSCQARALNLRLGCALHAVLKQLFRVQSVALAGLRAAGAASALDCFGAADVLDSE